LGRIGFLKTWTRRFLIGPILRAQSWNRLENAWYFALGGLSGPRRGGTAYVVL